MVVPESASVECPGKTVQVMTSRRASIRALIERPYCVPAVVANKHKATPGRDVSVHRDGICCERKAGVGGGRSRRQDAV
jgi:hypothetical protein